MIEPKPRLSLRVILADRTLMLMLALGFSSGLPLLLVLGTQTLRLARVGVAPETIGLITWVGLWYSLKYFWAPVIDEVDPPLFARRLGRRRAWLLIAQILVVLGLVGMAFADPGPHALAWIVACSTFTAFAAATQDIVIDGWRIDVAPVERQGVMAATGNLGYRLALLCSGALAPVIAQRLGWTQAYLAMACLMPIGMVAGLLSSRLPDRGGSRPSIRGFIEPLADLGHRYGLMLAAILLLVALYRLPDFLTGIMANPLYVKLDFSNDQIAGMVKGYGVWVGIAGAFAGGLAIVRLGLMPALLIGGIAASASHLCLALLAASGKSLALLALSVSVENFAGNFAGAALIAYMSSLTSPLYAASQYALMSSLYALVGKILGGFSGYAVKAYGFPAFFTASSTIGIPVAVLVLFVWSRQRAAARRPADVFD